MAAGRSLHLPAAALHALREALTGVEDGDARLRDAGYVAGVAMYEEFSAAARAAHGTTPDALPLHQFAATLSSYLGERGWGAAHVSARDDDAVLRVSSPDWVEGEAPDASAFASCHYSTGMLAGFFGRAAGEPLAVLELSCRSAGAARCEFAIGGRAVLERLWQEMG